MSVVLVRLFAVMTNELHDDSLGNAGFFEEGDSGVAEGVEGETWLSSRTLDNDPMREFEGCGLSRSFLHRRA